MEKERVLCEEFIMEKVRRLTVIGAGYVGLPTAALFADAGFQVTAVDLRQSIIESINNCNSPIDEPGLKELIARNVMSSRLQAVSLSDVTLCNEDAIVITVQTPVDEDNVPNLSFLNDALCLVAKNLRKGMLVAVCSTIPPGTMKNIVKLLLESTSGLCADIDFFLAYVPERIAPGKSLEEFVKSPRIVGGIGPNSTRIVGELFSTVCSKILTADASTAEIAKVAENTFRDVNIAFANQLALICEQHNADVIKTIELANTHPRVNIHMPGPGVGGPCLVKDPYLLLHGLSFKNDVVTTARAINDSMPSHVVELTLTALKSVGKKVKDCRVAILGTAYKANVDDARFSPAQMVIKTLKKEGIKTIAYDPYCPETFDAEKALSIQEAANHADCLLVLTDHTDFKEINLEELRPLMNNPPIIIDGKRMFNSQQIEEKGFTYFGIGYRLEE